MPLVAAEVVVGEDKLPNSVGFEGAHFRDDLVNRFVTLLMIPERIDVAKVATVRAPARDFDSGGESRTQPKPVAPQVERAPVGRRGGFQVNRSRFDGRPLNNSHLAPKQIGHCRERGGSRYQMLD